MGRGAGSGARAPAWVRGRLRALGSGALALAGAAPAGAQGRAEHWQYASDSSNGREDDLPASQGEGGAQRERVRVQMHQLPRSGPLPRLEPCDFGLERVVESISGASPIHSVPDGADGALQVMSEATFQDERTDLHLAANDEADEARSGLRSGFSSERDRSALRFSTQAQRQFNENDTALGAGLAVSLDAISPERDPQRVGTQRGRKGQRHARAFQSAADCYAPYLRSSPGGGPHASDCGLAVSASVPSCLRAGTATTIAMLLGERAAANGPGELGLPALTLERAGNLGGALAA